MSFLRFYEEISSIRGFNPEKYLENKVYLINEFFKNERRDSVVVGISGGIDSALVVNIFNKAAQAKDSPIRMIVGLILPVSGSGTTGQNKAKDKALEVLNKIPVACQVMDLSPAYDSIVAQGGGSAWAQGQMASVLRTPALYYQAALLQDAGYRSIVSGTTNRDEGAYIGFYGKGSDGMVDIQPIGDLHKSEVVLLSKMLNVPVEIQIAPPAGDVWDGRVDEQMIGAPYWFIESYLIMLEKGRFDLLEMLGQEERTKADRWMENIEKIHKTNLHKYQVGLPARFVDVIPRCVPGGWSSKL